MPSETRNSSHVPKTVPPPFWVSRQFVFSATYPRDHFSEFRQTVRFYRSREQKKKPSRLLSVFEFNIINVSLTFQKVRHEINYNFFVLYYSSSSSIFSNTSKDVSYSYSCLLSILVWQCPHDGHLLDETSLRNWDSRFFPASVPNQTRTGRTSKIPDK